MTVSIFVIRPRIAGNVVLADLRGPDVVDPLLSTEIVARERGRNELDANSGIQEILLETIFRKEDPTSMLGVRTGQTILVNDELQGREYRAKIAGISHSSRSGTVITNLVIQKPASGFVIEDV